VLDILNFSIIILVILSFLKIQSVNKLTETQAFQFRTLHVRF